MGRIAFAESLIRRWRWLVLVEKARLSLLALRAISSSVVRHTTVVLVRALEIAAIATALLGVTAWYLLH